MCKPAGVRCHSDWRPAMTGSLGYRSATQLRAAFAAGAMAPADVVAELLDRAGGMDTASSGVTGLDPGGAHAAAVHSARRYRSGSARALEGSPVVVKDLIDAAGMPATYGSQLFRDHRPARDAEVVRRIRAAGGIVLGKTATHEFGWGVTTDGTAAGPIRNPWDPAGCRAGRAAARPSRSPWAWLRSRWVPTPLARSGYLPRCAGSRDSGHPRGPCRAPACSRSRLPSTRSARWPVRSRTSLCCTA